MPVVRYLYFFFFFYCFVLLTQQKEKTNRLNKAQHNYERNINRKHRKKICGTILLLFKTSTYDWQTYTKPIPLFNVKQKYSMRKFIVFFFFFILFFKCVGGFFCYSGISVKIILYYDCVVVWVWMCMFVKM